MERFSESDCSACGLPVPVDLMPDGDLVRYADAQATVEALQRQVMHLDKTLADVYAQRDGLQRERDVLRRQVDTQRRTIQRYQASHDEHTQLQALVRALPVYAADALITVDGDLDEIDRPALRSAVMELLEYRATLDATTPAEAT